MNRDFAFGVAGLLLAAGYYVMAAAVPQSLLADAVGPQGLPRIYAVALAALSIALMASSVRTSPASAPRSESADAGMRFRRAVGMLLIGVAYLAVVSWIGYAASIGALMLAATWYQGGAMTRTVVVTAACGALFFWLLFVALLGVPHPVGAIFEF